MVKKKKVCLWAAIAAFIFVLHNTSISCCNYNIIIIGTNKLFELLFPGKSSLI